MSIDSQYFFCKRMRSKMLDGNPILMGIDGARGVGLLLVLLKLT